MATRYDLVSPRKDRDGKTRFTKVGVMFPNRNGDGFSLSFEALPIPTLNDDGALECRVLAMVPRENDRAAPSRGSAPPRGNDDLSDDVPF